MAYVKQLPYQLPSIGLERANTRREVKKHLVTILKPSASKKRKAMQQLIKRRIEQQLDTQAQKGLNHDLRLHALASRADFYRQKYGSLKYASDGVTIL